MSDSGDILQDAERERERYDDFWGAPEGGTCRTCGQDLVRVPGSRTYHPAADFKPPCSALLPIPGYAGALSLDVPDDQFVSAPPGSERES